MTTQTTVATMHLIDGDVAKALEYLIAKAPEDRAILEKLAFAAEDAEDKLREVKLRANVVELDEGVLVEATDALLKIMALDVAQLVRPAGEVLFDEQMRDGLVAAAKALKAADRLCVFIDSEM